MSSVSITGLLMYQLIVVEPRVYVKPIDDSPGGVAFINSQSEAASTLAGLCRFVFVSPYCKIYSCIVSERLRETLTTLDALLVSPIRFQALRLNHTLRGVANGRSSSCSTPSF